jgi:hypothetical protein
MWQITPSNSSEKRALNMFVKHVSINGTTNRCHPWECSEQQAQNVWLRSNIF